MSTHGLEDKAGGRALPHAVRPDAPQGLKIVPIHEVSTFDDGETLDVPGRPRVVHVPGHTDGSCTILLEGKRALITGDALLTRNPLTGSTGPQIAPDGLNRDSDLALWSLDALASLAAEVVLPGHGGPWTDGIYSSKMNEA